MDRYGPQNRASWETCLREPCEHPASQLGAQLQTSEPGERGVRVGSPANGGVRAAWHSWWV